MKIEKNKLKLFTQFCVSYFCIMSIPLLIGTFVYSKATDIIESYAMKTNRMVIDQGIRTFESKLDELDNMSKQLCSDNDIYNIANIPPIDEDLSNAYRIKEYVDKMPKFGAYNFLVKDYFIYLYRSKLVLAPGQNFLNWNTYVRYMKDREGIDLKLFNDYTFHNVQASIKSTLYNLDPNLLFLKFSPSIYAYPGIENGFFIGVVLDADNFKSIFEGIVGEEDGFFILNEKNETMLSIGKLSKTDLEDKDIESKYIMTNVTSEKNWKYISLVDKATLLSKVSYIKRLVVLCFILIIVIGTILIICLSYKKFEPLWYLIEKLSSAFGEDKDNKNYNYVKEKVDTLLTTREDLNRRINENNYALVDSLLRKLMSGVYYSKEEIENSLKNFRIEFNYKSYVIFIIYILNEEDICTEEGLRALDSLKNSLKDYMRGMLKESFLVDISEDKIGVLLGLNEKQNLTSILNETLKHFKDDKIFIAVGGEFSEIERTFLYFNNAEKLILNEKKGNESSIKWYDDDNKNQDTLGESIRRYIEENYSDESLNLCILCEEFNLKESYLYQFFKTYFGVTFASYLENLRMENACKFLKEKDYNIKFISTAVGYSNDHSFRRAFKRVFGMLPTEYREKFSEEEE